MTATAKTWSEYPDTSTGLVHNTDINRWEDSLERALSDELRLSEVPEPLYVAHRGGSSVYPENTLEAFRAVLATGHRVIEGGDCYLLRDGALGVMHDPTVDRTTSGTGNVVNHTSASWKNLTVDASSWFASSWKDTTPPLFEDVCREVRRRAIMFPESKNVGAAAKIVTTLKRHGMTKNAVVQSFIDTEVQYAVSAGLTGCFTTSGVTPSVAAIQATGATYASVDTTCNDATIAALIAAGIKVIVYTIDRRVDRDTYLAKGVSGFFTDDPLWVSGTAPVLTSDPFALKTFYHGHIADVSSSRGVFVGTNRWGQTASGDHWNLLGFMSPVAAALGTYRITATVTYDALTADATRWSGFAFCCPTDTGFKNDVRGSGYLCFVRQNGELKLFRQTNGTNTLLGTQATAAITTGNSYTLQFDVTPTSVTATRTDVGAPNSVTAADTTYRGGYVHFGKVDGGATQQSSLSAVTVT